MRTARWLLVVILLLVLSTSVVADIVHLKDGGKVEGEIVREDAAKIVVKTRFGEVTVERSRIKSIEEKKTPVQIYRARLRTIAADDPDALFELAVFCRENRLKKQEKELYAKILELNDQHDGACEAVGRVKWDGRWITPEERDRLAAEGEDAAKRAEGLVKYKGEWVTPEEKENREKGLVKYQGKWMTPDDVQIAKGFVKLNGKWVRKEDLARRKALDFYKEIYQKDIAIALTDHVAVAGTYSEGELTQIAQAAEQAYQQFCSIMGIKEKNSLLRGSEEDRDRRRLHIVYSKRALEYQRLIKAMKKRYPQDISDSRAAMMSKQKGFYFVYPSCIVAGYQMPNTFEQVRASVIHKTSHVLLMRYRYRAGFFPWWLIEGLGTYQEISALGSCDTYCISEGGYAVNEGTPAQKWAGMSRWKAIVKQQVVALSDRSFRALAKSTLNELDFKDLAKCWSFCEWAINNHREKFVGLINGMKSGKKWDKAFEKGFGKSWEHVEKEWRDYVRSSY
jgi:hypothetical protein